MPVFELTYPEGALEPDARAHLMDDVTTPEGALSDRRRAELVSNATRLIREAAGIAEDDTLQRVWVLMHEVTDGQWGAGGEIMRFEKLRELARAEQEIAAAGG